MAASRFKNDVGQTLSIPTTGMALGTATTIELLVRKPDDTEVTWSATANVESAEHVYVAGDLDQAGLYTGAVRCEYAGGEVRHSSMWQLAVGDTPA